MNQVRVELAIQIDPRSGIDRAMLPSVVAELKAQLDPLRWAAMELLALEVLRQSSVDRETRRVLLQIDHRSPPL